MLTFAYPTLLKHYINQTLDTRRKMVQQALANSYTQIEQVYVLESSPRLIFENRAFKSFSLTM